MKVISLKNIRVVLITVLVMVFISGNLYAKKPFIWKDSKGLSIRGYDPVEYFTSGKPRKGLKKYQLNWRGATWRFASSANMKKFKENKKRYTPQYGGYCAWAVSRGYTAPVDPYSWTIVKGKLYLNYNRDVQKNWLKNRDYNIKKGNINWPSVLED